MHTLLLVGKSDEALGKEVSRQIDARRAHAWDIVRLGGQGIGDVREFRREIMIAPRGTTKIGVIENMESLSQEAQNALLKILEEPPANTIIIGTTTLPDMILPTILSRMEQVPVSSDPIETDPSIPSLINDLLNSTPGKILATLETRSATKDDTKKLIAAMIPAVHRMLITTPSPRLATVLRNLLDAQSQLSVNVNHRLVIDNIFLQV